MGHGGHGKRRDGTDSPGHGLMDFKLLPCIVGVVGVGGFFSTVYKAVPSRDRIVTETTCFALTLRCHTFSRCFSLHALKMVDSVPLDTAVDSVPIPIARQKMGAKGGHKATLSDDV